MLTGPFNLLIFMTAVRVCRCVCVCVCVRNFIKQLLELYMFLFCAKLCGFCLKTFTALFTLLRYICIFVSVFAFQPSLPCDSCQTGQLVDDLVDDDDQHDFYERIRIKIV